MFLNSLSGRFLILTVVFVMLAEVLIFVPSVARFREDYLASRLERAQIASLTLLATDMISDELAQELLDNAEVYNVVLVRDQVRQLVLSSPVPKPIYATYDLRSAGPVELIRGAVTDLWHAENRMIRVIGDPVREGGLLIEVTMATGPLRAAMIDYGLRILALSAVISAVTALLLFLAVRRLMVKPIKGVVGAMARYAEAPEDNRRIIEPSASVRELREAETALQSLQTQLTGALRQKERLAQLGGAVAKISHDLRNILTTAQLFADRIDGSEDPAVRRMAPKLINSMSRAMSLCESTLAFGKAEEPPPALERVTLSRLVDDVLEGERLSVDEAEITFTDDIPAGMTVRADGEQLFRVLSNLVRNARQAIEASAGTGEISIVATEDEQAWHIRVSDTGPGLPAKAQEHLFRPFQSGSRRGTGLGLTIAAELVRGHGGALKLDRTGPEGTVFQIELPKSVGMLEESAA
ncbi:Signal transduction histidine kinase [Tranquillimonas rosea]|uniref:histidine kinase n=1 Tax=Tranquillimonas rosea TaxID=641238 RepID=A0A1H9X6Z9_9RHOB|nr:HAMP domain-containing sensor histidine kinase [Tranquillimonas rosea]SES41910.1 Signal transduction histidine kinase [Tranquillimonas rosea]